MKVLTAYTNHTKSQPVNNLLPKYLDKIPIEQDFIDNPSTYINEFTTIEAIIFSKIIYFVETYETIFFAQVRQALKINVSKDHFNKVLAKFKKKFGIFFEQRGWNTPCDYQFSSAYKDPVFLNKIHKALLSVSRLWDDSIDLYRTNDILKDNIMSAENDLSKNKSKKELKPTQKDINKAILEFKKHLSSLCY